MPIERTNLDDISEADLRALIEAGKPEGLTIEYKRDLYGTSDAEKKEALKDITSFANSVGGHLIIGMEEASGVPTQLTGLPDVDSDALISRLESLVRDGIEPRILGIRMRAVSLSSGGAALVIRIPRSWNPPHRVRTGGHNRFYVRNSSGAHEADVEELRVLFTLAADVQQRIKTFRSDRIATIVTGRGPVPLCAGGRLVLHLVPLPAFGPNQIDLERAFEARQYLRPIGVAGMTSRFNLDGFVNLGVGRECEGYTQVFRNGVVEAVRSNILRKVSPNVFGQLQNLSTITILHAGDTLSPLVEMLPRYFEGLRVLDVPAPIVLMVSFVGVAGAKLGIWGYDNRIDEIQSFPRDESLLLPEVIIDDYGSQEDQERAPRPIFDALWNAAGFARCTYYDENGKWHPPH